MEPVENVSYPLLALTGGLETRLSQKPLRLVHYVAEGATDPSRPQAESGICG